jgi:hypothetical protein
MANRLNTNQAALESRLHQFAQAYDFGALLNIPSNKPRREVRPPAQFKLEDIPGTDHPVLLEDRVRQLAGRYDFGVLMKGVSSGIPFVDEIIASGPSEDEVPSFLPKPDPIAEPAAPIVNDVPEPVMAIELERSAEPIRSAVKRQTVGNIVTSALIATVISLVISLGVVRYGIGTNASVQSVGSQKPGGLSSHSTKAKLAGLSQRQQPH